MEHKYPGLWMLRYVGCWDSSATILSQKWGQLQARRIARLGGTSALGLYLSLCHQSLITGSPNSFFGRSLWVCFNFWRLNSARVQTQKIQWSQLTHRLSISVGAPSQFGELSWVYYISHTGFHNIRHFNEGDSFPLEEHCMYEQRWLTSAERYDFWDGNCC